MAHINCIQGRKIDKPIFVFIQMFTLTFMRTTNRTFHIYLALSLASLCPLWPPFVRVHHYLTSAVQGDGLNPINSKGTLPKGRLGTGAVDALFVT